MGEGRRHSGPMVMMSGDDQLLGANWEVSVLLLPLFLGTICQVGNLKSFKGPHDEEEL